MPTDMFLKIEGGPEGESGDDAHAGEIDVLGYKWELQQTGSGRLGKGHAGSKVEVGDLIITKHVDKATPNLMQACATGKHFASALLTCRKAGGDSQVEYLKIELTDVLISKVESGGTTDGERVTENIGLDFGEFKVTYTPQKEDGTADSEVGPVGWNLVTNKAV